MLDVRNSDDVEVIGALRVGRELQQSPHLVSVGVEMLGKLCVARLTPQAACDFALAVLAMAEAAVAHAKSAGGGADA